jgi:putative ABC transport system ATP-binding protein
VVNRPSIVLADEPTGNLDSRTSLEVMGILQELNENGLTVLLVTHEPDIAQHAKRVVTFKDGHVVDDRRVEDRRLARDELLEGASE